MRRIRAASGTSKRKKGRVDVSIATRDLSADMAVFHFRDASHSQNGSGNVCFFKGEFGLVAMVEPWCRKVIREFSVNFRQYITFLALEGFRSLVFSEY